MTEDIKKNLILTAEENQLDLLDDLEDTNSRGVIVEILRNGKIAYISSGLEQTTGFKVNHIIGTDIHNFIEQLLGENSAKQLWPLISEVLRGTRQFLESQAKGFHAVTEEEKLYLLQLESSSQNFNRSILFIQDQSLITIPEGKSHPSQLNYMRILEKGNLLFLRSDVNLNVTEILGDTEKILGIKASNLEENPSLWLDILSVDQDSSLRKAFYR
ncbi:MAG: PAS domain-containing protein, partial [Candidatus Paceibacterota bacterium]